MAEKMRTEFVTKILGQLQRLQLVFASTLFLLITAESFGAELIGEGFLGGFLFLLCSLFLCQIGIMYLILYRYYRKSPYGKKLKAFLINMTLIPLVFVVGAVLSFLFEPIPLIHRAYALAFLSFVPLSHVFFRLLVSHQFPG